jgi:hypothetical protein
MISVGRGWCRVVEADSLRPSRRYAVFKGVTYEAHGFAPTVALWWFEPGVPPEGFRNNDGSNVWTRVVQRSELERYYRVETTCWWNDAPFLIRGFDGSKLSVSLIGGDGGWMSHQPGMRRVDKLGVDGELDISQVSDIVETITEYPIILGPAWDNRPRLGLWTNPPPFPRPSQDGSPRHQYHREGFEENE